MKKICFTLVLLLVAFVANAQQYKVYSVSGNVTVDGKPAAARQVLTGKSILSISKGGKKWDFSDLQKCALCAAEK